MGNLGIERWTARPFSPDHRESVIAVLSRWGTPGTLGTDRPAKSLRGQRGGRVFHISTPLLLLLLDMSQESDSGAVHNPEPEEPHDHDGGQTRRAAPGAVDWVQWWMLAKVVLAFAVLIGFITGFLIAEILLLRHLFGL